MQEFDEHDGLLPVEGLERLRPHFGHAHSHSTDDGRRQHLGVQGLGIDPAIGVYQVEMSAQPLLTNEHWECVMGAGVLFPPNSSLISDK